MVPSAPANTYLTGAPIGTVATGTPDAPLRSSSAPVVPVPIPTPNRPDGDWATDTEATDAGTTWVILPVVRLSSCRLADPVGRASNHM